MRTLMIALFLAALTACTTTQPQVQIGAPATSAPQVDMPNPASVYCKEMGNKLVPAADSSQPGLCILADGGACEEWAYYRGECCPAAQKCPTPATTSGGSGGYMPEPDPIAQAQASGGYMAPGTTEQIAGWWGVIKSTPPGSQYDDYFQRQDLGQPILFGIDSPDPAVQAQIKALCDTGTPVRLYGTLLSNLPDYNGSQILVARVELLK